MKAEECGRAAVDRVESASAQNCAEVENSLAVARARAKRGRLVEPGRGGGGRRIREAPQRAGGTRGAGSDRRERSRRASRVKVAHRSAAAPLVARARAGRGRGRPCARSQGGDAPHAYGVREAPRPRPVRAQRMGGQLRAREAASCERERQRKHVGSHASRDLEHVGSPPRDDVTDGNYKLGARGKLNWSLLGARGPLKPIPSYPDRRSSTAALSSGPRASLRTSRSTNQSGLGSRGRSSAGMLLQIRPCAWRQQLADPRTQCEELRRPLRSSEA